MKFFKAIKPVLLSLSLLYALVSGFGMAAKGIMPLSGTPTCAMLGHENLMCPMSEAEHFNAWESTFRAILERQQALPIVIFAYLSLVALVFINKYLLRLQGKVWEWKWPPGCVPLFIWMISTGTHQRLTYG